jgi:hypothetical protein
MDIVKSLLGLGFGGSDNAKSIIQQGIHNDQLSSAYANNGNNQAPGRSAGSVHATGHPATYIAGNLSSREWNKRLAMACGRERLLYRGTMSLDRNLHSPAYLNSNYNYLVESDTNQ